MKTAKEFNEKYKDYLEEGHYGLAIDEEVVVQYLDYWFSKWIEEGVLFTYSQIKTKFNFVCFYHKGLNIEQHNKIQNDIKGYLAIIKPGKF
jgi:hypothetical protein